MSLGLKMEALTKQEVNEASSLTMVFWATSHYLAPLHISEHMEHVQQLRTHHMVMLFMAGITWLEDQHISNLCCHHTSHT